MPIKLRPSGKRWIKDPTTGRSTNNWEEEHYYIKNFSTKELFEELNKHSQRPKVKQKIRNELVRRGIKIIKNYEYNI